MVKIIKYGCEYNLDKKSLASINPTYDGLQIIMNDQTELRFQFQVSPQIKALVPIMKSTGTDNMTLNLDQAILGNYDKVLILTAAEQPKIVPQVITVPSQEKKTDEKPTVENNTNEKKTKTTKTGKRIGRPPKSSK